MRDSYRVIFTMSASEILHRQYFGVDSATCDCCLFTVVDEGHITLVDLQCTNCGYQMMFGRQFVKDRAMRVGSSRVGFIPEVEGVG